MVKDPKEPPKVKVLRRLEVDMSDFDPTADKNLIDAVEEWASDGAALYLAIQKSTASTGTVKALLGPRVGIEPGTDWKIKGDTKILKLEIIERETARGPRVQTEKWTPTRTTKTIKKMS